MLFHMGTYWRRVPLVPLGLGPLGYSFRVTPLFTCLCLCWEIREKSHRTRSGTDKKGAELAQAFVLTVAARRSAGNMVAHTGFAVRYEKGLN